MKNSRDTILQRHKQLLYTLEKYQEIRIDSLSALLQISPTTLRRDLRLFEERGIVQRFHGGARLIADKLCMDSARNTHCSTLEARQIVRRAAEYVEDGDTIFVNASFPGILLVSFLQQKDVTVITNDPDSIHMLRGDRIRLILTGGEVHDKKNALVGESTIRFLSKLTVDKAFIGTEGISAEGGVTTSCMRETDIDELMVERSRGPVYYLAMPESIGQNKSFMSIPIPSVHHVITTEEAPSSAVNALRQAGVTVEEVSTDQH